MGFKLGSLFFGRSSNKDHPTDGAPAPHQPTKRDKKSKKKGKPTSDAVEPVPGPFPGSSPPAARLTTNQQLPGILIDVEDHRQQESSGRARVVRAVHYLSCFKCNKSYQFAHELERDSNCFICRGSSEDRRAQHGGSAYPRFLATNTDVWSAGICGCGKEPERVVHKPATSRQSNIPIIWEPTEENVEHMGAAQEITNNFSVRTENSNDVEPLEVAWEMESIHRPALTTEGCQTDAVKVIPIVSPANDEHAALNRRRRHLEDALALIDLRLRSASRDNSPYRDSPAQQHRDSSPYRDSPAQHRDSSPCRCPPDEPNNIRASNSDGRPVVAQPIIPGDADDQQLLEEVGREYFVIEPDSARDPEFRHPKTRRRR